MKVKQNLSMSAELLAESKRLGDLLARLRVARGVLQMDAALRAGLSRNTAYRLEKGDPGVALGQVLRYLDAIAPGKTLQGLLQEDDPALKALAEIEVRQRVRAPSETSLNKLDF